MPKPHSKAEANAGTDLWEMQYLRHSQEGKRWSKREMTKARRRAGRVTPGTIEDGGPLSLEGVQGPQDRGAHQNPGSPDA